PAVPGGPPPRRPRPRHAPDPVTVWARRHSHQGGTDPAALARHDRVARRFAAACEAGDTAALEALLAPDAIVVSDGGGKVRADARPAHGAAAVARFAAELPSGRPRTAVTAESVNGRTGLVLRRAGRAVAVVGLSTAGDEVTAVWAVLNPDKLRRWHQP
ncbi:nuclear transport factor 2 family protein, partial [Spirillospora sp. NPDC029432]|uniref:nuclear transport factor 2 family protein n=1 Tax=Spirillospora sp. NPDC029432 TaxID=3154599 RepID=UPI003456F00A